APAAAARPPGGPAPGSVRRSGLAGDPVVVGVQAVVVGAHDAERTADVVGPVAASAGAVVVADVGTQAATTVVLVAVALLGDDGGGVSGRHGGRDGGGRRARRKRDDKQDRQRELAHWRAPR